MDPRKWSGDSRFQNSAKRSGRKIPKRNWLHVQKLIAFCSTKLIEFDQILNELWWWSRIVGPQEDKKVCKRKYKQDIQIADNYMSAIQLLDMRFRLKRVFTQTVWINTTVHYSGDLKNGLVCIMNDQIEVWVWNGLDLEWDLKSWSPTIWNPDKWLPFCQKNTFEIQTKKS